MSAISKHAKTITHLALQSQDINICPSIAYLSALKAFIFDLKQLRVQNPKNCCENLYMKQEEPSSIYAPWSYDGKLKGLGYFFLLFNLWTKAVLIATGIKNYLHDEECFPLLVLPSQHITAASSHQDATSIREQQLLTVSSETQTYLNRHSQRLGNWKHTREWSSIIPGISWCPLFELIIPLQITVNNHPLPKYKPQI